MTYDQRIEALRELYRNLGYSSNEIGDLNDTLFQSDIEVGWENSAAAVSARDAVHRIKSYASEISRDYLDMYAAIGKRINDLKQKKEYEKQRYLYYTESYSEDNYLENMRILRYADIDEGVRDELIQLLEASRGYQPTF